MTTQVRLFHQGREVFAGPESPLDLGQQIEMDRLVGDGMLRLNPDLVKGDYVLQIILKDQTPGKKARVATQWIDFEIVSSRP